MNDPKRLLDDDGPGALLLASARDDAPPPGSFERTARHLGLAGAAFGVATVTASSGAAGTAAATAAKSGAGVAATKIGGLAGLSLVTKLVGLAVVGIAVTTGVVVATSRQSAAPGETPSVTTVTTLVGTEPPRTNAAASEPSAASAASAPSAPSARAFESARTTPPKARPSPGAAPDAPPNDTSRLRDEVALLDEARAAIASGSTDAALAALGRHRREHPHGFLSSEADVLRVEALVKAGRMGEARSHGEHLLAREPNGPHAKRLRSLLGP